MINSRMIAVASAAALIGTMRPPEPDAIVDGYAYDMKFHDWPTDFLSYPPVRRPMRLGHGFKRTHRPADAETKAARKRQRKARQITRKSR